jgi:hypothetical protein
LIPLSGIRGVRELDRLTREYTTPTVIVNRPRVQLGEMFAFTLLSAPFL